MRHDYTSRLAREWLVDDEPEPWRELHGSAVLTDLSGFTRLTESLTALGAEGAEVLHRSLMVCFATLLGPSVAVGGDIVGFAGDAALVWFDGEDHERRALEAAAAMPYGLARLPAAVTGGKRLRVSVGVHTGSMHAFLIGAPQRGLVFAGSEVSKLVRLQTLASPGQVLASDAIVPHVPAGRRGASVGDAVALKPARSRHNVHAADLAVSAPLSPQHKARCLTLLDARVREVVTADLPTGDHRTAAIGFVALAGLDDTIALVGPAAAHEKLHRVATTIERVASDLGIAWLDTDVGSNSVKLLLAAGVTRADPDDDGRMLLALRRILDEAGVPLKAGAQRGAVFAGALGVPGRLTFTVLGDAANVAARALGFAEAGELIVGDTMAFPPRLIVSSESLGPTQLRNRAKLVDLHRVSSVVVPPVPKGRTQLSSSSVRVAEREQIALAWKECADGSGRHIAIMAEPGMGGSELLADAIDRAGTAGSLVVADPYRRQVPYGVVRTIVDLLAFDLADGQDPWDWLSAHATQLGPQHQSWLGDGRTALQQTADGPSTRSGDPTGTARRARAVLTELLSVAAPRPWMLAVDDVDAIDDASRQVLADLADRSSDARWLILTSAASLEAALGRPAESCDLLTLLPIERSSAYRYVADLAAGLRDDQIASIVDAAGGNPLVLAELALNPLPGQVPDSLDRLCQGRIDALPVTLSRLIRDASVIGTTVPLDLAAQILGSSAASDPETWRPAHLILRPGVPGTVVFRHNAYRASAYASLSFHRRRELHSALADALATRGSASKAELASHYHEAGREREAYPLAVDAARSAARQGATVEARRLLELAVEISRDVDRPATGRLLGELGQACMMQGDLAAAETAFASAARVLTDPNDQAGICSHRSTLARRQGRALKALRWARQGLTLVPFVTPSSKPIRLRLLLDEAVALDFAGRSAEALAVCTEVLDSAVAAGDRSNEGLAHLQLEMLWSATHDPRSEAHARAAISIFEDLGDDANLGDALNNAGLTAMYAGDWSTALERYRRGIEVAERSGDSLSALALTINEGFLSLRMRDLGVAEDRARRALRSAANQRAERYLGYGYVLLAQIAADDGRPDDADAALALAREIFDRLDDRSMLVDCDVAAVGNLVAAGRFEEALAADAVVAKSLGRGLPEAEAMLHLHAGRAAALCGNFALGASRLARCLAITERHSLLYERFLALSAQQELAAVGGPAVPTEQEAEHTRLGRTLGLVPNRDVGA